jgi:hypothetical protein
MATTVERRLVLAVGAILIMSVAFAATLILRFLLISTPMALNGFDAKVVSPEVVETFLPVIGFAIAALTSGYLLWDRTTASWRQAWLYTTTVLTVGIFSWANYSSSDSFIPVSWQAILNLVLAFSGCVSIALLWNVSFSLTEAKILKYISIVALCAFSVLLPIMLDLAYVGIILKLINKDEALTVLIFGKTIAAICALGGLALGVLKYLDERRKPLT